LPTAIEKSSETREIRREFFIDEQTFIEINYIREEQELELFANPRNLAAGTIKTLDLNEVPGRNRTL
jgi:DNA ligase (NAD+)